MCAAVGAVIAQRVPSGIIACLEVLCRQSMVAWVAASPKTFTCSLSMVRGERFNEPKMLSAAVSGLLVRQAWPLALMLCADRVPILFMHSGRCDDPSGFSRSPERPYEVIIDCRDRPLFRRRKESDPSSLFAVWQPPEGGPSVPSSQDPIACNRRNSVMYPTRRCCHKWGHA